MQFVFCSYAQGGIAVPVSGVQLRILSMVQLSVDRRNMFRGWRYQRMLSVGISWGCFDARGWLIPALAQGNTVLGRVRYPQPMHTGIDRSVLGLTISRPKKQTKEAKIMY